MTINRNLCRPRWVGTPQAGHHATTHTCNSVGTHPLPSPSFLFFTLTPPLPTLSLLALTNLHYLQSPPPYLPPSPPFPFCSPYLPSPDFSILSLSSISLFPPSMFLLSFSSFLLASYHLPRSISFSLPFALSTLPPSSLPSPRHQFPYSSLIPCCLCSLLVFPFYVGLLS